MTAHESERGKVDELTVVIRKIADNLETMGVDAKTGTIPALRKAADDVEALSRQLAEAKAAENEACAKLAESEFSDGRWRTFPIAGSEIAAAIRARVTGKDAG